MREPPSNHAVTIHCPRETVLMPSIGVPSAYDSRPRRQQHPWLA